MKTNTFTIQMGTATELEIEIPESFNAYTLVSCFAKAYVEHTTKGAIVSDEVLFSSIGSAKVREAMLLGFREQCKDAPEETKAIFEDVLTDDNNWVMEVLYARYGKRDGFVKMQRRLGSSEETIEKMLQVMDR